MGRLTERVSLITGAAQGQGCVQRGRRAEERHVSGDGARIIIDDDCEPWPRGLAVRVHDQDIERGVIGLPERIRRFGAMPVNEFVAVAKCRHPFVRQGRKRRIDPSHNGMNGRFGRRGNLSFRGDLRDLTV